MAETIEVDVESLSISPRARAKQPRSPGNSSGSDYSSESQKSQTSTKSLAGSTVEQIFENGRQYCSEIYFMPNDDAEQTRLAIAHQAYLLILDGQLSMARVPQDTKKILDIGTGNGDWAIAIAQRFPNAEVIATDIGPFQPTNVPPNVFFEVDDAQGEWTYTAPFDLIHIRGLSGAFSDWTAVYQQAYKHLRPGGYLEVADFGLMQVAEGSPDTHLKAFNGAIQAAAEKAGTRIGLEHMRKAVLENAGLSVAKSQVFEVPLGIWASNPRKKAAGKMALVAALESLEAMSMRLLTREMAWDPDDVRSLCENVSREVRRPGTRPSIPCQIVVARRVLG